MASYFGSCDAGFTAVNASMPAVLLRLGKTIQDDLSHRPDTHWGAQDKNTPKCTMDVLFPCRDVCPLEWPGMKNRIPGQDAPDQGFGLC